MKLFLKEHISYILIYIFNFSILFIFYNWIGGFDSFSNRIYFIFLCLFILFFFLIYKYSSNRELYKRLSSKSKNMEEILVSLGISPLSIEINNLLREQYRLYQKDIEKYKDKQKENLTFINQWAHQMKTPLSVINLIVQENENELYMDNIKNELEKLNRGLDMALYMARLDAFTHDFHADKIMIEPLIKQVINDMKRYFIINNVFPEIDIQENLTVFSDSKWFMFILEQLITNGVKYSYMKSNKIYIKAYKELDEVKLEIIDRGVGIPKKDIKRVFQPFYTGENGRRFGESTGMGLYIVEEVCKKLSHDIEIESEENLGTTVRIIFN